VKKMLGACGAAVAALHRERIGGLLLADYPELAVEGSVLILTLTLILT
jgi:16S rRNA U516 pseudouridylate synthase RsuA-like enzyme|tara:strand:+ start:363 stop:506 length:144 start_codon:yes stop_codon:yes gene_type:complete